MRLKPWLPLICLAILILITGYITYYGGRPGRAGWLLIFLIYAMMFWLVE
jgi:hypothetical protein